MALYDPNEFPEVRETNTDFTLADVLAWARTMPADEEYDYLGTFDRVSNFCAVERFLKETGRAAKPMASSRGWSDHDSGADHPYDRRIDYAARNSLERTFGGFASRLEKALS